MTFLPDTNACIALLRASEPRIIARWRATPVSQMALCSVVVYELRHGAERCRNPQLEHLKLDGFLEPYLSLPFDDVSARRCAEIRRVLEADGARIGPHDLQIAAIALQHRLTLITHNTREFARIPGLQLEDWTVA